MNEWRTAVAAALVLVAAACGQEIQPGKWDNLYTDDLYMQRTPAGEAVIHWDTVEAPVHPKTIEMHKPDGSAAAPYDSLTFRHADGQSWSMISGPAYACLCSPDSGDSFYPCPCDEVKIAHGPALATAEEVAELRRQLAEALARIEALERGWLR